MVRIQGERDSETGIAMREAHWNDADLHGIWDLCRQSFPPYRTSSFQEFHDLWHHRWVANPARSEDHVFGWVLEDSQEGIIGYIGLVPVRLQVGAIEVVGSTPHSWAVKRAHATRGLSLYQQVVAWGDRQFLLETTAGTVVSSLNSRLKFGFCKVPVEGFDRRFLWLIRPEVPVLSRLGRSSDRAWLARLAVGRCVVKAAARARYFPHRRLKFRGPQLPVEPVTEFTDEYSEFWEQHKRQYGVTTVRDRAFLEWRHLAVPRVFRRTHVLACRERGRLKGYITLAEPLRDDGFSPDRWRVTDVFYDRTREDVLGSLMNQAFALAYSRGCAVFEASQIGQELARLLEEQRPLVLPAETWNYWYKSPTPLLARLCERESWWPSGVDGDSNL